MINYRSRAQDAMADACYLVEAIQLANIDDGYFPIDRYGIEYGVIDNNMDPVSLKKAMNKIGREEFEEFKPWIAESSRRLRARMALKKTWNDAAVPLAA